MTNPLFKKLSASTKELVNLTRELSKSQKRIWQQVPFLALQADGRTGYSDQYSRAYRQGYWAVESTVHGGSYSVYVDLETGELVSAFDPRKEARDEEVLMIASNPNQLDAVSLVTEIAKDAERPIGSYYNAQEQEKWRQETLKEYNLRPAEYRRKVSKKEVYEGNSIAGLVD